MYLYINHIIWPVIDHKSVSLLINFIMTTPPHLSNKSQIQKNKDKNNKTQLKVKNNSKLAH